MDSTERQSSGFWSPVLWLRGDGAAGLAVATWAYSLGHYSWILFAVLFLVPDVSFAAYLGGPKIGAAGYNLFHSYVVPVMLAAVFRACGISPAVPLIWAAHVGFDRLMRYGLKFPDSFGHTHLGMVGRKPAAVPQSNA